LSQPHDTRWLQLFAIWLAVCSLLALCLHGSRFPHWPAVRPLARILVALDYQVQDRFVELLAPVPADDDLVFLGLDEASLRVSSEEPERAAETPAFRLMAEPYPWSREIWALTVERLLDAGARLVILDFLFSTPREGDEALRRVLAEHPDRVLLISSFDVPAKFQEAGGILQYSEPVDTLIADFAFLETNVGFANFIPDSDGVIRRIHLYTTLMALQGQPAHPDEPVYSSLAAVALRHLGWDDVLQGERNSYRLRFPRSPATAYRALPLHEIFAPRLWNANYAGGGVFEDKIVLVGPAANQFQDIHTTPAGDLLGPQLHLSAITAARNEGLFRQAPGFVDLLLLFCSGLVAWIVVGVLQHPFRILGILTGAAAAFLLTAFVLLTQGHVLVSLAPPLLALFAVGGGGMAADHARVYRERLHLRRALEQRVSREVMEEILADPHGYLNELGGVRRVACVLFSDLRGFTAMTETRPPEAVLAQLNEYFDVMVGVIHSDRGMVDKFIGDAVMAIWGSIPPLRRPAAAEAAVTAALRMVRAMPALNKSFRRAGSPELRLGIGLHAGDVIIGNLGSEKRLELTAIGDTVNLASRLEGVTKAYGIPVIISEAVARDLGDEWIVRPLDRVRVVGRAAPIAIFEPLALPDDPAEQREEAHAFAGAFQAAFDLYLKRDFDAARSAFEKLLHDRGEDRPARLLTKRCRDSATTPPPDDWDGSVELTSK